MNDTDNMALWNRVCKTDPSRTKKANVGGNKITAIDPHYQIMCATKEFGPYGSTWGFKKLDFDFSAVESVGIVCISAVFYYPGGEFPILGSGKAYKDNAKTSIDQDFAKKIETDTLTKALSKIGFCADVFLGLYDDSKYVNDLKKEFSEKMVELTDLDKQWIDACRADISVLEQLQDPKYKSYIKGML